MQNACDETSIFNYFPINENKYLYNKYKRYYIYNIFTINYRWLVVIDSNLNLTLTLHFYFNNNN